MTARHKRIKKSIMRLCAATLLLGLTACFSREPAPFEQDGYYNLHKAASINAELALAYLQAGDVKRAKSRLLLAAKQDRHSAFVQDAMGYFYERTGQVSVAKTHYLRAIRLSNGQGTTLNDYGTFLCRQHQYSKSLSYFLKAANDPHYLSVGQAYENAGTCALAIPDYAQARLYFQKAIAYDPRQSNALLALSNIALVEQDYAAAQASLDQFNALAAPTAESLYLGVLLLDKV